MNIEKINKDDILKYSKELSEKDIKGLIDNLNLKDDNLRYKSFLLIQARSDFYDDCYKYMDIFIQKLTSDNSYQRSIGLMLIAANVKWDKQNKFDLIIDEYLSHINDEKFITSRQCIQSLENIIPYKNNLLNKIIDKINTINYDNFKDTQKGLIEKDINKIKELLEEVIKSE
jgi:hypothetical protein